MEPPRTLWTVDHPEAARRAVVTARSDIEARALAWREWYGGKATTMFEKLLRDAFTARDTGEPAK